jgi:hypothetical protein
MEIQRQTVIFVETAICYYLKILDEETGNERPALAYYLEMLEGDVGPLR